MGAGIAHAFLLAGARVHVVERDAAAADAARDRVETALARSAQKGVEIPDADALTVGTDTVAFADAGLVIEAVPEDRALKLDALARIEGVVDGAAVVASNTSSISIDALAGSLTRPERFLGLHFFNPVPASALVEVVTGAATTPEVVGAATAWVEAIGKTAVVVRDAPGFASSRLGVALGLEAIRMLEEGVASAHDIDTAMELGYRHPMGPSARPTSSVSTCAWASPKNSSARSARASPRPRCCENSSPRDTWVARPAADSTNGANDDVSAELRERRVVDARR